MLKTKNLIVFLAAALIVTAGCKSTDSKKAADPVKDAKTAAVKTNAKTDAKEVKSPKEPEVKKAVKADDKAKKDVKADAKDVKAKKAAKTEEIVITPNKNNATNYERNDAKYPTSMLGFAFCTPLQFPSEEVEVRFLRISMICAYNEAANGLDCGFICLSGTGGTKGLQAGVLLNKTAGPMSGLSISLLNIAETEMVGIQLGGYNEAGSNSQNNGTLDYETSCGLQLGAANIANSVFKGLQMGLFNISNSVFKGVQIGALNLYEPPSDVFDDFQTKEFNEEKKKRSCLQFGILNFNPKGLFPITILVNF